MNDVMPKGNRPELADMIQGNTYRTEGVRREIRGGSLFVVVLPKHDPVLITLPDFLVLVHFRFPWLFSFSASLDGLCSLLVLHGCSPTLSSKFQN